jgi:Peptidase inhibitor family I36
VTTRYLLTVLRIMLALAIAGLAVALCPAISHAGTARPDFTCPTGSVCTFTQVNLSGTGLNLPDSAIPSGTVFHLYGYNDPALAQSVRNRGGNYLWVVDREAGAYDCIPDGSWTNTFGEYGYGERTGAYPCSGGPPPGL